MTSLEARLVPPLEITKLWLDRSWCIRKIVRHDYAQLSGYKATCTTFDVDVEKVIAISGNATPEPLATREHNFSNSSTIALPLEWRPKRSLCGLDIRDESNNSLHSIRRSQSSAACLLMLSEMLEGIIGESPLPQCVSQVIIALVMTENPPFQGSKDKEKLDRHSWSSAEWLTWMRKKLSNLDTHHFWPSCKTAKEHCTSIWNRIIANEEFSSTLALYSLGYIRTVEISTDQKSKILIKTVEEFASPEALLANSSLPRRIVRKLLLTHWEVAKTLRLEYSADSHLSKVIAPKACAVLQLEKSKSETSIINTGGEWAYWEPKRRPEPQDKLHTSKK
ncbi:hypothetical protein [Buchananella hordeovulneris]|uniref:hypothetical protein n=1 Tax=Buchananella hordeovulneris TaxID=52770 RepID=UPI001160E934|nr:hypothetical protein [Buchananella hordeovulneris]